MKGQCFNPPRNPAREQRSRLRLSLVLIPTLLTASLVAQPGDRLGRTGKAPALRAPASVHTVGSRSVDSRGLSVDTANRAAVAKFYRDQYVPYGTVANAWTGNKRLCQVGKNSKAYDAATLQNLKYYRAMAGVPADVSFDEKYNQPARAAALIMEAKGDLSHGPAKNWPCYSDSGKKGAGSSNLCLGCVGPDAIDAYVRDGGVQGVGHRVWALHPRQKVLGTGSSKRAHALYVFGDWRAEAEVENIESVAWPAAGYMPYRQGLDADYPWSFQYHQGKAEHAQARVRMTRGGKPVSLRIETGNNGILVWYPTGLPKATHKNDYNKPAKDVAIEVEITNLKVNGEARSVRYTVTFMDPEAVLSGEDSGDAVPNESGEPGDSDNGEDSQPTRIDPSLNPALLRKAYDGDADAVRDLLKLGADPDARYKGGWTALMYAAWFGHENAVAALLKAKANAALKHKGWDAAGFAQHREHTAIVRMIEEHSGTRASVPAGRQRGGVNPVAP
ncbi:MAG: ankyrin repeat domain-containing protein [Leptospirales bacterium]|jgi:hypothetical protein